MKLFVVLALALVTVSAFDLRNANRPVFFRDMVTPTEMEGRITNGQNAGANQFPWQCSVKSTAGFCGGSLISATRVVTAAHCISSSPSSYTLGFGSTSRNNPTAERTVTSSNVIVHPSWNSNTLLNDIALMKIASIAFTAAIQPVGLPPVGTYSSYAGQTATASGWGKTSDNSGMPSTLQYANLPVMSNSDCSKIWNAKESNICVSTANGKSTCNGDSGGPLVLNKVLIGLTSYGAAAGCTKGYPAVFTRMTSYTTWIKNNS